MGTVFLRLREKKFWGMTPRKLISMIESWKDIEEEKAVYIALAQQGKNRKQVQAKTKREKTAGMATFSVM